MPNIIESLLPTFGAKTVFITDQNGNEVLQNAQFIKVDVKPESRPMEHPIETGAIITDHRIVMPVEIELSTILSKGDYKDVYKQINSFFINATLLTVNCRAGVFTNQLIQSLPHTEDAEQYDAIVISIRLKQVLIVTASASTVTATNPNGTTPVVTAPVDPTNATTQDNGNQNAQAIPQGRILSSQAALTIAKNNNPLEGLQIR